MKYSLMITIAGSKAQVVIIAKCNQDMSFTHTKQYHDPSAASVSRLMHYIQSHNIDEIPTPVYERGITRSFMHI